MSEDHYFTAQPASADERRVISVTLAGRDVELETARGVFSPGHLDLGTQVLLRHVPSPPAGDLLDLGCGWGPLAFAAALMQPAVRVTAVDVNERALDLVRRNYQRLAAAHEIGVVSPCLPQDVSPAAEFDVIWSNPPIRVGKVALHGLLRRWLPRLRPGGEAYLVVNRHLGADSLGTWIAAQADDAGAGWGAVDKVGSAKGFRVLRFTRAAP